MYKRQQDHRPLRGVLDGVAVDSDKAAFFPGCQNFFGEGDSGVLFDCRNPFQIGGQKLSVGGQAHGEEAGLEGQLGGALERFPALEMCIRDRDCLYIYT